MYGDVLSVSRRCRVSVARYGESGGWARVAQCRASGLQSGMPGRRRKRARHDMPGSCAIYLAGRRLPQSVASQLALTSMSTAWLGLSSFLMCMRAR